MMRLNRFSLHICLLAGLLLACVACSSDRRDRVPSDISDALYSIYPYKDIKSLEWGVEDEFFVAEFRMDGFHCKAWFDAGGRWYMTETSDLYKEHLPEKVLEAFGGGGDERYKVDFADVETRYVIQSKDSFYFYRENGERFKQVGGAWGNRPLVIGDEILGYLQGKFETYSIIDADMKSVPIKINIHEGKAHEGRYKAVYFSTPDRWLADVWKIQQGEVPGLVLKAAGEAAGDDGWDGVYRVEHQRVHFVYGFKLADGESLFISDKAEQVEVEDLAL